MEGLLRRTKDVSIYGSFDNSNWTLVKQATLTQSTEAQDVIVGKCAKYLKVVLESGYDVGIGLHSLRIKTEPNIDKYGRDRCGNTKIFHCLTVYRCIASLNCAYSGERLVQLFTSGNVVETALDHPFSSEVGGASIPSAIASGFNPAFSCSMGYKGGIMICDTIVNSPIVTVKQSLHSVNSRMGSVTSTSTGPTSKSGI